MVYGALDKGAVESGQWYVNPKDGKPKRRRSRLLGLPSFGFWITQRSVNPKDGEAVFWVYRLLGLVAKQPNPKVGRAKTQKTVELRARANPKDGRA